MFWIYAYDCLRRLPPILSPPASTSGVVSWVRRHFRRGDDWQFLSWQCDLDWLAQDRGPLTLHVLEQTLEGRVDETLLQDRNAPRRRLLLLEAAPGQYALLDGSGLPMTKAVGDAGGLRDDPRVISSYVAFFCAALLGDQGNFVVVDRIRRLIVDDARAPFERLRQERLEAYLHTGGRSALDAGLAAVEEAVDALRASASPRVFAPDAVTDCARGFPVTVAPDSDEHKDQSYGCRCVLMYGTTVFEVALRVSGSTGEVEMASDKPIHDFGQAVTTWSARRATGAEPFFVDPPPFEPALPQQSNEQATQRIEQEGRLENLWVKGDLVVDGSKVGPRCEIVLDNLMVEGDLRLTCTVQASVVIRRCSVLGRLRAPATRVEGDLRLESSEVWGLPAGPAVRSDDGGSLTSRPPAIDFERLHVRGSLDLRRVTAWGGVNGYQSCIEAHLNLAGLWMLRPFVEVVDGSRKVARRSPRDRYMSVSFEQSRIEGSVNLSPDCARAGHQLSQADRPRTTVVVGFMTFRDAKVGQSMCLMGLATTSFRPDLPIDEVDLHPSWLGLSLRGIKIGGSLTSYLSDTVQRELRNDRLVFRCVIGGDLDLDLVHVDGMVDLRGVQVEGALDFSGSNCIRLSLESLPLREIDAASLPQATPLDAWLDAHEVVVALNDEARLPVARVRGGMVVKHSAVEAGVDLEGTRIEFRFELVGSKIGGLRSKPFVASEGADAGSKESFWRRTWLASLRSHEVEFTRRVALYGTVAGAAGVGRPRPAIEFLNTFVNGGVFLHDAAIHDDEASIREKNWAYQWAGVDPRDPTSSSVRLDAAKADRKRRWKSDDWPDADHATDADALASVVHGDLCIVNCELDGNLDLTNAVVDGELRLNDSVVRADVRFMPFVKEPPGPKRYDRSAVCRELNIESLQCDGDLNLSGLRVAPREGGKTILKARSLRVAGELRWARESRQFRSAVTVDLTDVQIGRLVLPAESSVRRLGRDWRLDGFRTRAYGVEEDGRRSPTVLTWMRCATFNPQVYLDYERALVQGGEVADADQVYRKLSWRRWREQDWGRPLMKPLVAGYGGVLGFGTAVWRPILIWLLSFVIALAAVWRREDVQPSMNRIEAMPMAEKRESVDATKRQCPDDWAPFERVALAVRYAVPIVDLLGDAEWEPREDRPGKRCTLPAEPPGRPMGRSDFALPPKPADDANWTARSLGWAHRGAALALGGAAELTARICRPLNRLLRKHYLTPKQTTSAVRVLNWVLIPFFLLGVTARLQRRRS